MQTFLIVSQGRYTNKGFSSGKTSQARTWHDTTSKNQAPNLQNHVKKNERAKSVAKGQQRDKTPMKKTPNIKQDASYLTKNELSRILSTLKTEPAAGKPEGTIKLYRHRVDNHRHHLSAIFHPRNRKKK